MPRGIGTKGLRKGLPFKIKKDDELLKESIYNILTTRKGERLGNPTFGTTIYRYLFQPHIQEFWDAIKLEIVKDIESQEPRVEILSIEYITDAEKNKISLYIVFKSRINATIQELAILDVA